MPTILCLDLGTAHTGIAISYEGILADPLATVFESNKKILVGKLLPFIVKHNPEKIVIGIPNHGPLVKAVMDFKTELEKIYSGKIVLFPEDFSSRSAKSLMKETGKTLAKRKMQEHQTAAAIILEDYLDTV